MALAHGMDVKTLSATIGHISSATTLDIYSHIANEMQIRSAEKVEQRMGRNEARPARFREFEQIPEETKKSHQSQKWSPTKAKYTSPAGVRHHDQRPPLRRAFHTYQRRWQAYLA